MNGKKIQIGARPTANKSAPTNADNWVISRDDQPEAPTPVITEQMKRLTIDITENLHRDIKKECAAQGFKIADVTRDLLREWVQKQKKQ